MSMLIGLRSLESLAAWFGAYLPIVQRSPATALPYTSPVLITEVFYNTPDPEPELEWYEIYNRGGVKINLSRYKIGDGETKGDHESMYIFPDNASILPGQVVVIATRAASFKSYFGIPPDYEIIASDEQVPNLSKYRKWATGNTNLSDEGDEVLILNEEDIIVEAVSWKNSTFAFKPSVEDVPEGSTIARKPANFDSDRASDWIEPLKPSPGTVDLLPATPTPTHTSTITPTPTITPTHTRMPCGPAGLLISEVLYDPVGSEDPFPEWVEVFNFSNTEVNLACIKIGDEETRLGGEGMLRFPEEAQLGAGEVAVVANRATSFSAHYGFLPDFEIVESDPLVRNLDRYDNWAIGNVNLSNTGDEVLLLDGSDMLIDAVSWGSSAFAFTPPVPNVNEGHSIERFPANNDSHSASDWRDQPLPEPGDVHIEPILPTSTNTLTATSTTTPTKTITPTITQTNTPTPTDTPIPCGVADLLISEVLYNPAGVDDPDGEWIEVFNPSANPVYLGCIKVGDEETAGGGEGMARFPGFDYLDSGEVIVIANQAAIFLSQFGFFPDYELSETDSKVPNMVKYTTWATGSVNLSNGGDDVLLLDGDDQVVDAVSWEDSAFAFNPPVATVSEGHSIERRPANYDSDTALDWLDQSIPAPGQVNLTVPTPTRTPTRTPMPSRTPTRTPTPTPTPTEPAGGIWVINEIQSDPDSSFGDANGDGAVNTVEDEFVEIVNNSESSIDITGWKIHDGGSLRHTFPAGSIVASGCSVVVFGGGTPTGYFGNSLVQISSTGNLGLNDRIDVVTLFNLNGIAVAGYSYGLEAGENQSITRDPDIIGPDPLVKHSLASGSNGALYSPGTEVDGNFFYGCP